MPLARWQASVLDDAGNVVVDPVIDVLREGDGARPSLYSDREGATAIGNPFTGESDGYVSFHVIGGAYRITATKGAFSRTWRYAGIGTAAESDLPLSTLFNPSGLWDSITNYAQNDLVQWGGGSFISNDNDNLDNEPLIAPLASNEFWTWVATPNDNVAGAIQFAESDLDGDGPIVVDGDNKMPIHVKGGLVEFWGGLGSWTLKLLRAQLMTTGYGLAPSGAHRDAETFANMASRLTYAIPKISDAVNVSDDVLSDETQVSMDVVGDKAVAMWASRLLTPGTTYITRIRRKSIYSSAWDGSPAMLFDRTGETPPVSVYPSALKTDRSKRYRQHGIFQLSSGRLHHRYSDDLWVTYSVPHMIGDGSELVWSGGDLIQLPNGRFVVPTYNDAMTVASVHVCDDPDGRGWSKHSTIADEASTGATSTNEAALCLVPELNMVFAAVRTHDEIGADTEPLFRSISIDDLESDDAATWTVLPDGTWNGKGRPGLYAPGGGALIYTDRSYTPSARYAIGRKSLNGAQTWSEQYTIDTPIDGTGNGGQTAAAPIGNGTWLMLMQSHGIIKARNFTDEPQDSYPVAAPGDATVTMAIGTPGEVTDLNHHLAASTPVLYTTTGALLTGVPAVVGYVKLIGTPGVDYNSKYNLSATPGGAAIAFSGTQSGVHTRHAFTASVGTLSAVSAKVHRDRDKVDFLVKFGLTRSGAGTSVLTIPPPERSGDLEGAVPFWRVVVTDDATGAEVGRTAKRGANIEVTVTVANGLNNLSINAKITL